MGVPLTGINMRYIVLTGDTPSELTEKVHTFLSSNPLWEPTGGVVVRPRIVATYGHDIWAQACYLPIKGL